MPKPDHQPREDSSKDRTSQGGWNASSSVDLSNRGLPGLPEYIGKLTHLRALYLSGNRLTSLAQIVGKLEQLEELTLERNRLAELPESIGQMTRLRWLDLAGNELLKLPESLGKLARLERLDVPGNRLTSLPESIGRLTQLRELNLAGNQLKALPGSMRNLTQLEALFLHGNEALGLPPEILGATWEETLSNPGVRPTAPSDILTYYFTTLRGARPLNEVKLLLVGRGGAGKSSIRDGLLFETFDPNKPETQGIDIRDWVLDCGDAPVRVHVWDFAGQVITHATHQFFLTERSVYLLVLDGRSDTQDRDAEYWLRLIAAYGKSSPVIVALNRWDEKPFGVDQNALRERYPTIRAFFETDCRTPRGLRELKAELIGLLHGWKEVHEPFPKQWWGVKERLTNLTENYISFDRYRRFCSEENVTDGHEQASLARILRELGVILHYADDARLRDTAVLSPIWATTGIYTLLRLVDAPRRDGVFSLNEAAAALPEEPREMVIYLLGLMRRFELCYPLDQEETNWLVPELLDRFQPTLGTKWNAADATRLRYRYTVLPEGLLPRFIVRTHPLSEGKDSLRWRNGVVLRLADDSQGGGGIAEMLVRAEALENRVSVVAIGAPVARLRLVKLVRSHFAQMHADFPGPSPKEELEVDGYSGSFKDVQVLERNEQRSAATPLDTDQGTVEIDTTRELNRTSAPAARNPKQPRVKLFVSYAHTDAGLLDVFKTNLELMKMDGLVSWWFDGQIRPSSEWDSDIRRELEEADIIVLMVSTAFLSRPYIRGVELGRAIQRKATMEAEIFILVLEPECPWKTKRRVKQRRKDAATGEESEEDVEVELGKFQALLPKNANVQRWQPRPAAFNHVDAALREMIGEVLRRRTQRGER